MTIARFLSASTAAALIVFGSVAWAEDTHTGVITGINRLNDSIAIKQMQNGTVGANAAATEQSFKVTTPWDLQVADALVRNGALA